jgi:uroporphyrin-III C-methyltransferase/precorrin-2 dehydrogenase/sirohydrochlorin ferrochelatase
MSGRVSLVGAGPGAPDLLTERARERLAAADVVFHDGLVPRSIVALAHSARRISVARRAGPKPMTQDDVTRRLIASARSGHRVVRLKSGDPFVFGRGGEEMDALARAGIDVEIVPGLTSAVAAPALAGIPITRRGMASAVVLLSGHDAAALAGIVSALTPASVTLVILMGLAQRAAIRGALIAGRWPAATPAAVIVNASRRSQRTWRGTVGTLADRALGRGRRAPGVIVIGAVAGRTHGRSR